MEGLPGDLVKDRLKVLNFAAGHALELGEDRAFGRLKHAIESTKDRHGQHDILVLIWSVWSSNRSATDQMKLAFSEKLFISILSSL